ncbi:MAG: stage II sporulation protein M [Bacillota bacterium]
MLQRRAVFRRSTSNLGGVLRSFWLSSLRRCWLLYLISFFLFGAGFAWGVEGASSLDRKEAAQLEDYLTPLVEPDENYDHGIAFRRAVVRNTVPVAVMYFAGLTVVGLPVVAAVLFLRGYALGFTSGFLIRQKGVYGLGIILAELLPQNVLLLIVLVVGAVASFSFSLLLLRRGFDPATPVFPWFLRYTGIMVLLAAAASGAGVVESYVVPGMAGVVLPFLGQ